MKKLSATRILATLALITCLATPTLTAHAATTPLEREDQLINEIFTVDSLDEDLAASVREEIRTTTTKLAPQLGLTTIEFLELIQTGSQTNPAQPSISLPSGINNDPNSAPARNGVIMPVVNGDAGAAFVTVPLNYVYNPKHPKKSLHDYCTASPNNWFDADFRGPCARHDMAYEKPGGATAADHTQLLKDLRTNCAYAYSVKKNNPKMLASCNAIANTYYAAVKIANGK